MVRLLERGIPHRQDAVADVIDDRAAVVGNLLAEPRHQVANHPASNLRPKSLRQGREAPHVAEEDGHFLMTAFQQVWIPFQLAHQLRGEKLVTVHRGIQ